MLHKPTNKQDVQANETWHITASAHRELQATIGTFKAEEGVMLGGDRKTRRITQVYVDHSGDRTVVSYAPDIDALNSVLRNDWKRRDIDLLGFGHSHPMGYTVLSEGDKRYARDIMAAMRSVDSLLLPIFQSTGSGAAYGFRAFLVVRAKDGMEFSEVRLVVDAEGEAETVAPNRAALGAAKAVDGSALARPLRQVSRQDIFTRVVQAYDLDRLARCRIVSVGCGGAIGFLKDMARCGVGEFVLIDPDTFTASNVATQMADIDSIGQPKVEGVASRLRRINPYLEVVPQHRALDDLNDAAMRALILGPLHENGQPPLATVLCGFTDSFHAQARCNRLALNLGVPSLCAQVYAQGLGAELTFTHPDTTPACHRCILRSRFEAYLEENFVNTVGSAAAPIFATTRLNAAKGPLALALLHHGTNHPRWGRLLARIGNRNLLQLRLDPDLALPVFGKVFGKNKRRVLFDEAVWLPQTPEKLRPGHRACPDCAGTGKLSQARGTFRDTRVMRN